MDDDDRSRALAVIDQQGAMPLTVHDLKARVELVGQMMKAIMQKGTHYDTVPGCGPKPTLLKPGAEKLLATFRVAVDPEITELNGHDDHYRYRVRCRGLVGEHFIGAGVGECSTAEDKYAWRAAVGEKEWDDTPETRRRTKYTKRYGALKQVRTNPADSANTVLKMAKKRAMVDLALTCTGASDLFTQDVEELPEEMLGSRGTPSEPAPAQKKPKASKPKKDATIWTRASEREIMDGDGVGHVRCEVHSIRKEESVRQNGTPLHLITISPPGDLTPPGAELSLMAGIYGTFDKHIIEFAQEAEGMLHILLLKFKITGTGNRLIVDLDHAEKTTRPMVGGKSSTGPQRDGGVVGGPIQL